MTEVLAVIDAATGTILDPSNLHVVVVSEEELDAVDGDDSATHDLAMKKGAHITQELLESLPHGVAAVCRALGCQVEIDNDGQYVVYTDEYDPGHVDGERGSNEEQLKEAHLLDLVDIICAVAHTTPTADGVWFHTPAQWAARHEEHGLDSKLIVVHDGPPLAPYFNPAYECDHAFKDMREAIEAAGHYVEQCTCWYSAIYPYPTPVEGSAI